jgi:hypothetical protein
MHVVLSSSISVEQEFYWSAGNKSLVTRSITRDIHITRRQKAIEGIRNKRLLSGFFSCKRVYVAATLQPLSPHATFENCRWDILSRDETDLINHGQTDSRLIIKYFCTQLIIA